MKWKYGVILFILVLAGISYLYGYQKITFLRPQSVHKWRQTDCASIALNYYQGGMIFFKPETHNLTSDHGTSGKCCTSEIPILYYSVAILYKIFGYHEYIYRIFNTLLFFLGLFFLFRLVFYLSKDIFWSIAVTILFFTSPVLVYYGNNFLSNSSALACSIIGWYYFLKFIFEGKSRYFYISMVVFLFAAAFKITALLSVFAIIGIFILELLGIKNLGEQNKFSSSKVLYSLSIISIILVNGIWIAHAHYYNLKHDCTYFSTTIFPVWNLNRVEIYQVLLNIKKLWLDQYFHRSVLIFLAFCFLFLIYNFRKCNKVLIFCLIVILAQTAIYFILEFWTFADHDYYTVDMFILPVLILIASVDVIKRHYSGIFNSIYTKGAFSLFLIFNIWYAHQIIYDRYNGWMNDFNENKDIYTITPYLRQIGISPLDTIISIPDGSNASLYLMNQKGWTEYTDARFNRGPLIPYNQDSVGIQCSIKKGAAYLIVNGIDELYKKPYLQNFCTDLAGHYKNVLIFKLKKRNRNFTIDKRAIDKSFYCNAERLSDDQQYFLSDNDSAIFQNGNTRTSDFSHSGKYSSKLNSTTPYGMTIKLRNLKNGESFAIDVWRTADESGNSGLVASSDSFYIGGYKVIEKNKEGWERIKMEIFISKELSGKDLVIYAYNPNPEPVYFDDLEIIRYKSVVNNFEK
jgi:hypothetical protein